MSKVFMHAVVPVDGSIADDHDEVGPLLEWYFKGDTDIVDGGPFKVSKVSAGYVRPMWDSIGAMVIGRRLFDLTNGREEDHEDPRRSRRRQDRISPGPALRPPLAGRLTFTGPSRELSGRSCLLREVP